MFKGSRRPGFKLATTLNTPIVIHKTQPAKHVTKDEVLAFLDKFVTEKESIIDVQPADTTSAATVTATSTSSAMINIDTNLSSALSQLKRIQRDFKGLPPASFSVSTTPNTNTTETQTVLVDGEEATVSKSATGGTKVKFD